MKRSIVLACILTLVQEISIAQSYPIEWTNMVNATYSVATMKLRKTSATAAWDAGAISSNKLLPYQSGWIEVRATGRCIFGFSTVNSDPNFSSIMYSVYLKGTELVYFEHGVAIADLGTIGVQDVIRLERLGSEVLVKKNGVILRTINVDASLELIADCSIYSDAPNWFVLDAKASFLPGASQTAHEISWTNLLNVTIDTLDETKLTKTSSQSAWDAGAISLNKLAAGQNGWVEYTAQSRAIVGLSIESDTLSFNGMTYGVYFKDVLQYFENGVAMNSNIGSYSVGDKIRFERFGNNLYIMKNGSIIHAASINPDIVVMAEVTIYGNGWYVQGAKASFDSTGDTTSQHNSLWKSNEEDLYYLNGNVGIGTDAIPSGYLLTVDGKILTEEVNVQLSENWPDYVFEEDYTLRTLNELELYINKNKHLPGIPSVSEVAKSGINLGEMNAKLLEKVEVLTLYLLELNDRVQSLEKENATLRTYIK